MAELPVEYNTEYALNIDQVLEEHDRGYFGMSYLGSNCKRYIQYNMYLTYPRVLDPNTYRIFNIGKYLEQMFYDELRRVGLIIANTQDELVGVFEHWKGHIDGVVTGVIEAPKALHLLEMKTLNDSFFKQLIRLGVENGFPAYYKQMQVYMDHGDYPRGLFVAMNKNTCRIYVERIYPNEEVQNDLRSIMLDLILEQQLYPRIGNDSINWFECRMCLAKEVCFGMKEPAKNCRTCINSSMEDEGKWHCEIHGDLPFSTQINGCPDHEYSQMFSN